MTVLTIFYDSCLEAASSLSGEQKHFAGTFFCEAVFVPVTQKAELILLVRALLTL